MIDPVLDAFDVTVAAGAAAVSCGSDPDCDDGNACTTDSCDTITGCVNDPINCDDGIACTTDSCDPATGECVSVDDGTCPNCSPVGGNCTDDTDCCSNKCRGKPGGKTCKNL